MRKRSTDWLKLVSLSAAGKLVVKIYFIRNLERQRVNTFPSELHLFSANYSNTLNAIVSFLIA